MANYACQKNMLPCSSLGIRCMMSETITISTPVVITGQMFGRTGRPSLNIPPEDSPMAVSSQISSVVDLQTQLSYFKNLIGMLRRKLGDADARALLGRAVYLFSIGINDYLAPAAKNSSWFLSYSREEYVDMVIGNLTIVIKEIHKNGGRKFGFQSLPPVGSLPSGRAVNHGAATEEAIALVILHNRVLPKVVVKLERKQLKGFRYSMANMYNLLAERTNYPSKHGFKEGKIACCGTGPYRGINSCGGRRSVKEYELCDNPREYVFFDSAHPSQTAHEQLAKLMWSGTPTDTGTYNLRALFEL